MKNVKNESLQDDKCAAKNVNHYEEKNVQSGMNNSLNNHTVVNVTDVRTADCIPT